MTHKGVEESELFHTLVNKLRAFFLAKGFVEVHTQDRLSILAACEDPSTVATFEYAGERWPLPQTGQMWLEYELLRSPQMKGVFCVSTSYRAEKNIVPGRHKIIFPMFEFESRGTIDDLRQTEEELLEYLGFGSKTELAHVLYDSAAKQYGVDEISHIEEMRLLEDMGHAVFLERFPVRTSPFWNMKKDGDHAHKIDVILYGNETIGSAERSTDKEEMRKQFYEISDGGYAGTLFDLFGRERVEKELEEFLANDFFPRYGGGIGMTRLIDAWKQHQALELVVVPR